MYVVTIRHKIALVLLRMPHGTSKSSLTTRMRVLMININRACAFLHQWLTSHASDFVGKAERRALLVLVDKYLVDTPKGRHLQMMVLHMVHKSSINTRIDWLLLLGVVELFFGGFLRSMIRLVFACVSVISTYHHHTTPTHSQKTTSGTAHPSIH